MTKLTCKRAKYLVRDEKSASREYRKLGLNRLAKDESRHKRFLKNKVKEIC